MRVTAAAGCTGNTAARSGSEGIWLRTSPGPVVQPDLAGLGEAVNVQAKQELFLLPFCRFDLGSKGLALKTYQISVGPENWGPLCNYLTTAKKA